MVEVKALYDEIENSLTVWFGNPADEYVREETGEEVILMKDKEGHVIGFEKLNYVADRSVGFQVGFQTAGAAVTAQQEREPDA
jgi:hypothetical protein